MPKECEKLFVEKKPKPLPLPTLKLSEPPGAVRPDGNQTSLLIACTRTVTSKINKHKSNSPDNNRDHANETQSPYRQSQIRVRNDDTSLRSVQAVRRNKRCPEIQKLVNKKNKLSP